MGSATRRFAVRVGGFYGAEFLVYGTMLPYLSVLLDARGLDAREIGIVSAVPLLLRLGLTPAVAVWADRHAAHRGVIVALAGLALAATLAMTQGRGFWPLLAAVALFQVGLQSMMPLIETIAMEGVRRHGCDYGRMRLTGSVTFIVATFAGAWLVGRGGTAMIAWLFVSVMTLTVLAAVLLPPTMPDAAAARPPIRMGALLALLEDRRMLLFLVAAGAVQSAHAVFYGFGVLQWRATGIPDAAVGALWSLGVIAEIILFWWSAQVLARVSPIGLLQLGAAAAVVRWSAMALDPPLALLVPLQVLHGLTYGAAHLGAMHFIRRHVPDAQAGSAQALYSTVTAGVGMGGAMMLAGYAYARFAGAAYLGMALLGLVGLLAARRLATTAAAAPAG